MVARRRLEGDPLAPVNEARTDRILPVGSIPRTGPDCWQIRARKRLGRPNAESARSATVSSEGRRAMPAARARVRRDAPTSDRVAALDALRVVSMAAVVALHASAAYMTVRIPGLIWLINEPAGSEFVQQFAWWSYGATMPAFFALAGYAAAAVLEVKGTRGYALDRARRVGLAFLAALPAV